MKRILSVLFVLAVSVTAVVLTTTSKLGRGVRAVYAQSGCTNANLNARYAFTATGFSARQELAVTTPEVPTAVVGVIPFDGAGNVSYSLTLVVNGSIFPTQSGTGTYTVNSNCTGSISFTTGDLAGIKFNMVIIGGGTEIFGILTNSGLTQTFDAKKQ